MSKDQEVEMAEIETDALGSAQTVEGLSSDSQAIVEHWRSAWSDISRTEEVIAQGPSFVLWYFETDGFENPGAFFSAEAIDQLIPPEAMREALRECLGDIDHDRQMAVVLVLKGDAGAAMAIIPKTAVCKPQVWFEMTKIRKTSISEKVWIPLRAHSTVSTAGEYGYEGFLEEYLGVGSVMFDLQHREQILKLGWDDLGGATFIGGEESYRVHPENDALGPSKEFQRAPSEQEKPIASFRVPFTSLNFALRKLETSEPPTPLKPAAPAEPTFVTTYHWAGNWASHYSNAVGTGLVIEQDFEGETPNEWHLHQDFVISLGLLRQGDSWLRPAEGFQEVVRLTRDEYERPVLLEVRTEHLRDYLKARGMYLLLASYRSRSQVVSDASHIDWASGVVQEVKDGTQWEGINNAIHEGGEQYGSSTGVFHVSRTDIDADDDVPKLSLPDDDSVVSKTWSIQHQGRKLQRLSGSLWKTEVVEPGRVSERVKGEPPLTKVDFAINGSGERLNGDELISSGGWLWFRPNVTALLGSYRGSSLRWFTQDTGAIGISSGYSVHFGLNALGLINVYAKDIGRLPPWQQRVWAGANVVPDGGVSEELLASQVKATPADTKAPEMQLRPVYDEINDAFEKVIGKPLFAQHHAIDDIFKRVHRFRALENTGVLELAKDLARVTVESLDGNALTAIGAHPGKTKSGSIKHLEAGLMKEGVTVEGAMALTKVLVGINQLRQADAHLPSSEFAKAFELVGVHQQTDPVVRGRQMLESLVESLAGMAQVFSQLPRKNK
ncbi:hypothetical protein LLY42_21005 [Pseudomonas frederiksbergensis]|nr:hypothetical protein LLY42_21005 [Pseudomonas frederiksbergensis]